MTQFAIDARDNSARPGVAMDELIVVSSKKDGVFLNIGPLVKRTGDRQDSKQIAFARKVL